MSSTLPAGSARRWRIRTVLLWLVLACLLPGMVGTAVLFTLQVRNEEARLQRDMTATARALVQAVDSQLFMARTVAQTLATSPLLVQGNLPAFHRMARRVLAATRVGANVVVSEETGEQLLNTLRDYGEPLPRHGNPELLQQVFASGQLAISGVFVGGVTGKPLISVNVPVHREGRVVTVLSLGVLPAQLEGVLTTQKLPSTWGAAVFDSEGVIAARTHMAGLLVGQKAVAALAERQRQSPEGWAEVTSHEGMPMYAVWSRSAVTGWSVSIALPQAARAEELTGSLRLLGLGTVGLLLLGLGLAGRAARKIAVSVRALTAPATAMRHEEVAPMPEVDIEEAADLAAAIDETARLLADRAAELRQAHRIAGFGVWRCDAKTLAMVVSDSVREMLGRDVPPFPALRGTLLSVQTWEQLRVTLDDAVRSGQGFDLELPVNHADGRELWVQYKGEAVRDASDASAQVVELRGSVLDITRRKQAELDLDRSRQSHLRQLEQEVAERTASLVQANLELERLNGIDELTGLQNRHAADDGLRQEFLRLKRTGSAYTVLFIDIDHFKQVNDTWGHETGDQVLRQLAVVLRQSLRATDFAARYGGEEFLVVLPDTDAEGGGHIAEKVREAVAAYPFPVAGRVTVSVGVAQVRAEDRNEEEAVHRADHALYAAKDQGRDRVCDSDFQNF